MKVLLDENLPHELRRHLADHDVYTVQYLGWGGINNGRLLSQAASAGFDVLVTIDQGIPYEQDVGRLPTAVIVLHAESNKIGVLLELVPRMRVALNHLKPNAVTEVY